MVGLYLQFLTKTEPVLAMKHSITFLETKWKLIQSTFQFESLENYLYETLKLSEDLYFERRVLCKSLLYSQFLISENY